MRGWRYLLIGLLVAALGVGGYYGYWEYRAWQAERHRVAILDGTIGGVAEPSSERVKMGDSFDATLTPATFRVVSVEENGRVRLRYLVPKDREGKTIEVELACPMFGNQVWHDGSKVPRLASRAGLVGTMRELAAAKTLMLNAKCLDVACGSVGEICSLTVAPKMEEQ